MKISEEVKKLASQSPKNPGIYQYYDKNGVIIYVGKAKNLRNRVSSYFTGLDKKFGKVKLLVAQIVDIKYLVTETELDALLLENNLIKKHQPKYNVMLKDDKTYPWICIKKEPFPRVFSTRYVVKDGSEYFGPYASVKMMNAILEFVQKNYQLRSCSLNLSEKQLNKNTYKLCLEYHIGNCKGACEKLQSRENYDAVIQEIRQIIKGNVSEVKADLKQKMLLASKELRFEEAQSIKSKIDVLNNFQSKSTVVSPTIHNVDVFSFIEDNDLSYVNYMKVNSGAIVQGFTVELKKKLEESKEQLLRIAILELRERFNSESKEVLVPFLPDIELPDMRFSIPIRGDKKKLLELSERNAKYFMLERRKQFTQLDPGRHTNRILEGLKKDLRLSELPTHIECFDNSNIQGTNPVAACVVFRDAKPFKKDYRHFNIKTVIGPDDFASMEEVVFRRYKRLLEEKKELPQLIVIDGGKGQLSSALKSLERLDLKGKIAIIGIAKRLEEIFYPGDKHPLFLNKSSESLKVLQHLRNEAHRFGITHHRNRRLKGSIQSELSNIVGIGEKTSLLLIKQFKSVKRIKNASLKELESVVNLKQAQAVYQYFND